MMTSDDEEEEEVDTGPDPEEAREHFEIHVVDVTQYEDSACSIY